MGAGKGKGENLLLRVLSLGVRAGSYADPPKHISLQRISMRVVCLLAVVVLMGAGCSVPIPERDESLVVKIFSESDAIRIAEVYLREKGLFWGTPIGITPHPLEGSVEEFTLYYATPEAEKVLLGPRAVIVTKDGSTRETIRA